MKLAILMPVVLQTEILRNMTQESVSHLRSQHQAVLYIICNRLHVCTPEILRADLQTRFQGRVVVVHEPGVERSVAGAWNKGCELALADGADYMAIAANDLLVFSTRWRASDSRISMNAARGEFPSAFSKCRSRRRFVMPKCFAIWPTERGASRLC